MAPSISSWNRQALSIPWILEPSNSLRLSLEPLSFHPSFGWSNSIRLSLWLPVLSVLRIRVASGHLKLCSCRIIPTQSVADGLPQSSRFRDHLELCISLRNLESPNSIHLSLWSPTSLHQNPESRPPSLTTKLPQSRPGNAMLPLIQPGASKLFPSHPGFDELTLFQRGTDELSHSEADGAELPQYHEPRSV